MMPAGTEPGGSTGLLDRTDESTATDTPWTVVVYNDPVNTMNHVTRVFQRILGVDKDKATMLMLQVHNLGKSTVADGTLEHCEVLRNKLANEQLWATLEKAGA